MNPVPIAARLRESGVRIIVIGVPDKNGWVNEKELLGIAGDARYMHIKPSFDDVMNTEFMTNIAKNTCEKW